MGSTLLVCIVFYFLNFSYFHRFNFLQYKNIKAASKTIVNTVAKEIFIIVMPTVKYKQNTIRKYSNADITAILLKTLLYPKANSI